MAFQFPAVAAVEVAVPVANPDYTTGQAPASTPAVATAAEAQPAAARPARPWAPPRRQSGAPARLRPMRRAEAARVLQAARRQATLSPQHTTSDEGLFILGVICALAGVVCLLVALFSASPTLALVGLGLAGLGVLLGFLGLATGHWDFG